MAERTACVIGFNRVVRSKPAGPGTTMSPGFVMMFEICVAAVARRRVCAASAHVHRQGSHPSTRRRAPLLV